MTAVLERTSRDPFAGEHWSDFVWAVAPRYFPVPFAPHHVRMWDWAWQLQADQAPDQHLVAVLARGGAKSTNAEGICAAVGLTDRRRYALYVCDTQDRADDHVANIGAILEAGEVDEFYPHHAGRAVGKYGDSKGWRRNRLRTKGGLIIDALGLDVAARGIKVEDQRPDLIVLDDIDGLHDTAKATKKKLDTLRKSVLPAGSRALAMLAVQNLILPDGVFAQLVDGRADVLAKRTVIGPVPALRNLQVTYDEQGLPHVDGEPTWIGQDVAECQRQVEAFGLAAFVEEAQHDVDDATGALWSREQIDAGRVDEHPELTLCVVTVDPSGGAGHGHDDQGVVAVGKGIDGHAYVLDDRTCSLSPMGWGKRAVHLAVDVNADRVYVEDNYGGETVVATVRMAADDLEREAIAVGDADLAAEYARYGSRSGATVDRVNAQGSKGERAAPVASLSGEKETEASWPSARLHMVGVHAELEREMRTWEPDAGTTGTRSPNRVDAMVHGVVKLGVVPAGRGGQRLTYRRRR